jgi:uncharacterized phage protein gp47/JayE
VAFQRPSLLDIIERIKADVEAKLTEGQKTLRKSAIAIVSRAMAAAAHLCHGHLEWVSRQIMPDTADLENLKRWASIWGVQQQPATYSQGPITITGQAGQVIDALSILLRGDGRRYILDAQVTIGGGGTVAGSITAEEPGADGDAEIGIPLSLETPNSSVTSIVVASPGLDLGTDEETPESLLERLLERIQEPPLGGAAADYERWAKEVPGVGQAWCYPANQGPGTVGLAFTTDDPDDPIPSPSLVEEVQDYIDLIRPVTADFTAFAPIAEDLDFTIELLPDSPEVRAAVEQELKDLLQRESEPGGTILISHIREAISIAAGEADHVLTAPVADVESDPGDLLVFGAITWE